MVCFLDRIIDFFVQIELLEHMTFPCYLRDSVTSLVENTECLFQFNGLRVSWNKFNLQSQFHITKIQNSFEIFKEIVIDSAKLSFCLIGTNSVDLYSAEEYRSGKICYERTKTRTRRADKARIEIKVRDEIKTLVDKYRDKKSERVFNFYLRYSTPCVYNKCLNTILKRLGKRIGVDGLQFYQFRHSWATIARNELNIDIATIDEALNHKIPHHALIDVYVKKDFRNINLANKKVIDFVFGNSSN